MSTYIFKRDSNKFDDILKDVSLQKLIRQKTRWKNHLMVTLSQETPENLDTYIQLKYGDLCVSAALVDRTPKPEVDYHVTRTYYKGFEFEQV